MLAGIMYAGIFVQFHPICPFTSDFATTRKNVRLADVRYRETVKLFNPNKKKFAY